MLLHRLITLAILSSIVASTVVPRVSPIETHVPLSYNVQIDDPPEVRWAPIIKDYYDPLHRFLQFIDLLPIPKGFYDGVEWYAKNEFIHQDFVREVEAVSKLSNLPFDKMFFINFMYQYSTFKACTAILVRTAEGTIMQGRNMDFQMWQILSKLLANINYYKGDKLIYTVDTYVGGVFAPTGIRHGAFAVNANTRKAKDFSNDLISLLIENACPTVWLLKKVLEEQNNYADANLRLRSQRIAGPVYFIISGRKENEGMVIERQTNSVNAYYELSETNWFLIQTNYDRDQPDPLHDPRRIPVQKKMADRGNKNFTKETLFNTFMFEWPTFNIATIMTAVMIPVAGYHNTTVWYGSNPKAIQLK